MVDTSLVVAIIGVGGTLFASGIGAYVNLRNTKIQQENQNQRRRAEFYIEMKVEYLSQLYNSLIKCERIIHGLSMAPNEGQKMWINFAEDRPNSKPQKSFEELEFSVRRASVFLEDEDARTMSGMMVFIGGVFEDFGVRGKPGRSSNHAMLSECDERLEEAKRILRRELSEPVKEIAK